MLDYVNLYVHIMLKKIFFQNILINFLTVCYFYRNKITSIVVDNLEASLQDCLYYTENHTPKAPYSLENNKPFYFNSYGFRQRMSLQRNQRSKHDLFQFFVDKAINFYHLCKILNNRLSYFSIIYEIAITIVFGTEKRFL